MTSILQPDRAKVQRVSSADRQPAVADLASLPKVDHRIRFGSGLGVEVTDPGTFLLVFHGQRGEPQRVSDWMIGLLQRMAESEVPQDQLQAGALAAGGPLGLFRWVESLRRLDAAGLIEHSCYVDGALLCRLFAVGPGPTAAAEAFNPAARLRTSPLAVVSMSPDRGWVAQRPGSHLAVQLGARAMSVIGAAGGWTDWTEIERGSGLAGPVVRAVLEQLARASVVEQREPHPDSSDTAEDYGLWNPFDWWLHARSRGPRSLFGWAGSYPGEGRVEPLPAVPPRHGGVVLALPTPDLRQINRTQSGNLVAVMERRRSIREHDDDNPITAAQLGELLYRTIRIREVFPSEHGQTAVDRPIPNGGALHELEVYPLVQRCCGVEAGLWHYRADSHELEWVAAPDAPGVGALLSGAHSAYTMPEPPQVVLIIAARFGRVQYKYDAIPYALTLKNTGVLLANLYLVATDMRLAGTAVGSGALTDFAEATGLSQFVEGSVGEFVVGSSRPAAQASDRFAEWEQYHGVPLPGDAPGA